MKSTVIKRDEMPWRAAHEELFDVLAKRELCDERPARIKLDRNWFQRIVRELASQHAGFSFNSDNFTLWGIRVELDWTLPKDSGLLEVDRP